MQIHELNNFSGTLGSGAYLAVDDGNDTGKVSKTQLFAATEARIDNIIAGDAPSAAEIVDARLGADGVTYTSLGTGIRSQFTDVKSEISDVNSDVLNQGKQLLDLKTPMSLLVPWEVGEWNYQTETINTNAKSRISSSEDFTTDGQLVVYIADGYSLFISKKTNGSYNYGGWKTTSTVLNGTYRFIIRDNNSPDADADLSKFVRAICADTGSIREMYHSSYDTSLRLSEINPSAFYKFKNGMEFVTADIVGASGADYGKLGVVKCRISTRYIYQFDYDINVTVSNGYKFNYFLYGNKDSATATTASGWKTSYTIPKGECFRIQIIKDPEDYVPISDAMDNDLYKALTISKVPNDNEFEVPSYWKSTIDSKISTINNKNCNIGGHGDSFIFMTDYHATTSNKVSPALIKYIQDNSSVSKFIYGGDTTDGATLPTPPDAINAIRKFANRCKPLNMFPIRGNHDVEPTANQTVNQIPDSAYYDVFIRPIEDRVDTNGKLYYLIDNESEKIRYIMMDSGGINDPLNERQLNWMKAALTELESGWTAFVFQHVVGEGDSESQKVVIRYRGQETINAINEVIGNMSAIFGGIIAGHAHNDYVDTTTATYPIIYTTCDSGGANSEEYDWANPIRTAGTTNECAFDVFSIDTVNREITITRIGAGNDRQVSY